jgi:hypothetical protein
MWARLSLVVFLIILVNGQVSKPVAHNSHIADNKFRTREIADIEKTIFGTDASRFDPTTACPHRIFTRWTAHTEASVYSTPVIVDIASDGVKDIVVPNFIRHINVLDGPHGKSTAGFPFSFPNSAFYASPIIYDINFDGEPDIGVTTFNGELIWLTETGMPLLGYSLKIPHLKVTKNWYEGLKADPQDMEHMGRTQFELKEIKRLGEDPYLPMKFSPRSPARKASKADSEDNISILFESADSNTDARISREEFVAHIRRSGAGKGDDSVFDKMDFNKDGELTMDEVTDQVCDRRSLLRAGAASPPHHPTHWPHTPPRAREGAHG